MANFLELVNLLQMETDSSGAALSDITPAVIGTTGELARLVQWIKLAWNDVQTAHIDWGWMRTTMPEFVTLGSGHPQYSLADIGITNFGAWARDSFRNYQTSVGYSSEVFMDGNINYESWRDSYFYGALRTSVSRPMVVAVAPDKSLCFGPVADTGYTIVGDYFTGPVPLVLASDVPALPTQFHYAIVYKAMMYYGSFMGAPEVFQRGEQEFAKIMLRLDATQLPGCTLSGTMA